MEKANRAALVVDAADYYRHALEAMQQARSQIILIGWDVDTRVPLVDEEPESGAPRHLGPLISWLSRRRPELEIYILVWDHAAMSIPGRGTTMLRLARWATKKRIHLKFDHMHPLAASHHQKTLVIDDEIGFCGGIDITADRWDTRHHKDNDPGRRRPFTRRVYEPWHDAIMAVDGRAAEALGDLARIRWKIATGNDLPVPADRGKPWPKELKPIFRDVEVGIARTRGREGSIEEIREIEALFVDLIERAERFVYVETQYFASRVVAEAIGRRLAERDGPEFVVVNPRTAYGWLDETVMSPARYELVKALREKDEHGRFRIYYPVTEGGADIYVHAKIMIVDDDYLRVGSANMNNRSMGLDSECDLLVDGTGRDDVRRRIADIRTDLIAEHLGLAPRQVGQCFERTRGLISCIEELRGRGRTLVPLDPENPGKIKKKMAKSELLDPEAADELFEPRARPGLLAGIRKGRR
ncbi:MAG TPA: phospholipase D-like domain-containing protein [Allosphingosinicella sp.]|nr:phospholipase D-like domain-containing protein [Allosphingosinicella sp.]